MGSNGLSNIEDVDAGAEYQDTIALLQDEIGRLEEELRLRDEASADLAAQIPAAEPAAVAAPAEVSRDAERIAELTAEMARRDETIALLLEELRLVEQAEAAGRAEWEQLNQWVEQVEQRVESRAEQDTQLEGQLAAERRQSETARQAFETDRRTWESQRRRLEEEVQQLRSKLSNVAMHSDSNADLALAALEAENRRLRKTCDQLSRAAAAASEVESLREQNTKTQAELDKAHAQLRAVEDDVARERKEHEAALAALRRELTREPLQRREGQGEPAKPAHQDLSLVTAEERMLAFRQHLQEVHQRELEERSQNRLSARLSRLWHRTGPAR